MTLLSNWDNPNLPNQSGIVYNDIWGWSDSTGKEYAIMGSLEWTYFIDISIPGNPIVRDSVQGKHIQCIHRDFKTYQQYCYGVADEGNTSTLQVIDMSFLPDSVHVVQDTNEFFVRAHNIFIDEAVGRLYAVGTDAQNQGVIILDLATDPTKPTLLANHNLGSYSHDLYVRNDTAYMNNGNNGLTVVDFTSVSSPVTLAQYASYPGAGYNHSSWLTDDGNHLVVCDETHNTSPQVLDVSDLTNISRTSAFRSKLLFPDSASIPHNPLMAGDYAVLSYYHDGIQLFDISDPSNPVQTAWYDTELNNTNYAGFQGCWGAYPYLPSGTVIASDIKNGLFVFRVGFPFPYALQAALQTTNATCPGGSDGSALVTPSGGTGPYTYAWSNGNLTNQPTNLAAGTYMVTVSDRYSYTYVDTVSITAPGAFLAFGQVSQESCPNIADGAISLLVIGGTPGYSYAWSTGDMTRDINGLTAGTYTVTITDTVNCTFTNQFTVGLSSPGVVAQGGNDQSLCITAAQLTAVPPSGQAVGQWQVVSGNGSLFNASSASTAVSGLSPGQNLFAWVVTEGVCTDVDTVEVYASAAAFVDAGANLINVCGSFVQLNGSPVGQGTALWAGNGVTFSNANNIITTATVTNPGSYPLTYSVTEAGCSATDSINANFVFFPDADFSSSILGFTVNFNNLSQYATGYLWSFGDGNTSTQQNPTHTYAFPGNYQVCLSINNDCGQDTFCQDINLGLVGLNDPDLVDMSIYPNPTQSEFTLSANGLPDGPVTGKLMDVAGKMLRSLRDEIVNGQLRSAISLADFPEGMYLLEVHTEGFLKVFKVLRRN